MRLQRSIVFSSSSGKVRGLEGIIQSFNVIKLSGVKKIVLIAQERPAFLHAAPLVDGFRKHGLFQPHLVRVIKPEDRSDHEALAAVFGFDDALQTLDAEPSTQVGEVAALLLTFEQIFGELKPDFVIPGGHDNASLAGALAASTMNIPVVSLEAGLRSYDRTESDEINRLVIDSIAAHHCVSEHSGMYNLINEGYADDRILFVGNTAIDSLVALIEEAKKSTLSSTLALESGKYIIVLPDSSNRPETHGTRDVLGKVLDTLAATSTVILPCDTVLQKSLRETLGEIPGLRIIGMPGYIELLGLLRDSAFVLTDTDEFEAELTVMNVACLTMRTHTSRPSTVETGTNLLVGCDEQEILERASLILSRKKSRKTLIPEKWDGAAAARVAKVLEQIG